MTWIKLTTGDLPRWINMATVGEVTQAFGGSRLEFIAENWDDIYVDQAPEVVMRGGVETGSAKPPIGAPGGTAI